VVLSLLDGNVVFDHTSESGPATTIEGLLALSHNGGVWRIGRLENSMAGTI